GELRGTSRRRGHEQYQDRRAAGEPVQQPESERTPRVAARVRVRVLSVVRVAMEVKVRAVLVRMQVQVPAAAHITQDDRCAEPDQEQCDEKVGGRPQAIGKMEAE